MSKATELRQERHAISLEMGKALELNTPAGLVRWKELDAKQEKLYARIQEIEKHDATSRPFIESSAYGRSSLSEQEVRAAAPEYRASFREWARTGDPTEKRALSTTGDGQTLVPVGFQKEIATYMKFYGGLRYCARRPTDALVKRVPPL